MGIFAGRKEARALAQLEHDVAAEMPDIIPECHDNKRVDYRQSVTGYYADNLSAILDIERGNEAALVADIAAKTERLRQTRLVIEQLEPARQILDRGGQAAV